MRIQLRNGGWAKSDELGSSLTRAEFSLPRYLFGNNGRVLETQTEIDLALEACAGALDEVSHVSDVGKWAPKRIDIAWNFALPARSMVLAHSALRLPGIRKGATTYPDGEGASWRGAKSHFMVTFYDKAKKMQVAGSVLRVEISLRAGKLGQTLPWGTWRSFNSLYQVYRAILIQFPDINSPCRATNLLEAIAPEATETRLRILSRVAHIPPRTLRRYREQIERAANRLEEPFSWGHFLPKDSPPPAVVVNPRSLNVTEGK